MAKKKEIKADPNMNHSDLAEWEKRFPPKRFEIVNGELIEVPNPSLANVAARKNRR